ncbi:MAG: hypothetical protein AB2A00_02905 [Myxococcota bacterium]
MTSLMMLPTLLSLTLSAGGTDAGSARRVDVEQALLRCARLTFLSAERQFEVRVGRAADGTVDGMQLTAHDGNPLELLCPADDPDSATILGSGKGRSWGRAPKAGSTVGVSCLKGLDGTGGACSAFSETSNATARSATAESLPELTNFYDVSALGVEQVSGAKSLSHRERSRVHRVVFFCAHTRQPKLTSGRRRLVLDVTFVDAPSEYTPNLQFSVVGADPEGMGECLSGRAGRVSSARETATVRVTYELSAGDRKRSQEALATYWTIRLAEDRLEGAASPEARATFVRKLGGAVQRCMAMQPSESLSGRIQFRVTMDANARDEVRPVRIQREGGSFRSVGECASARFKTVRAGADKVGFLWLDVEWVPGPAAILDEDG